MVIRMDFPVLVSEYLTHNNLIDLIFISTACLIIYGHNVGGLCFRFIFFRFPSKKSPTISVSPTFTFFRQSRTLQQENTIAQFSNVVADVQKHECNEQVWRVWLMSWLFTQLNSIILNNDAILTFTAFYFRPKSTIIVSVDAATLALCVSAFVIQETTAF